MPQYINKVKEFHETFGHPINDQENEIDLKTRQLRIKLIFEELEELAKASDVLETFHNLCYDTVYDEYQETRLPYFYHDGNNVDKKEELDALVDIEYVLSGAVLCLGYHDVYDEAFDEVHSSNMSKMCLSLSQAEETIAFYKNKQVSSHYIKKDGGYIVLRNEDNKILKNIYYKEASLNKFIK